MAYENILVETKGAVGIVTLNHPKALNALSAGLVRDLGAALDGFEADANVRCVIITGSENAFAAGADFRLIGPRATLVGAAAIGGVVTLGALFLPGMRAIEGEAARSEEGSSPPSGPDLVRPPVFVDV